MARPTITTTHCTNGVVKAQASITSILKNIRLLVAKPHTARINSTATQEETMSMAASSGSSWKRLRPGKVKANASRHRARSGLSTDSLRCSITASKVPTVTKGSRNAATKDVTDSGALKKVGR